MVKSWKVNKDESDPLLLRVEIRILSEAEGLSRDAFDSIEHVIVTSVHNIIKRTTKKIPHSRLISELILFEPKYRLETRNSSEIYFKSPPIDEEEE